MIRVYVTQDSLAEFTTTFRSWVDKFELTNRVGVYDVVLTLPGKPPGRAEMDVVDVGGGVRRYTLRHENGREYVYEIANHLGPKLREVSE